jgi:histidinol-phosphate/aromatic aminotransferase/cobyric acid decarboxylase-like protein
MTDNEIKEDCLQEAGIDLGRYSHKELTEIKDALRRYHNAKLKLESIVDVSGRSELLRAYFKWNKEQSYISHKDSDIDEFLASYCQ